MAHLRTFSENCRHARPRLRFQFCEKFFPPPEFHMPRTPAFPLAEHPLDLLPGRPECSLPASNRTYLTIVMLENSLRLCAPYVKGKLLDVGCGQRPYEK